jgi:hypothetical protein
MNDDTISITRPSTIVGGPPIAKQPSMSQPVSTNNTGTSNKLTNNFPTETIELPSQGHFYPDGHPLSDGHLELKMMTAREEDILTNQNLIRKGIVLDRLLESLIVTPVKIDDILVGDKNAVFFAARRLAYGDTYGPVKVTCPKCQTECERKIDLSLMKSKEVDLSTYTKGQNEFEFLLPYTKKLIKYKLLTHKDELTIDAELKAIVKINKNSSSDVTTRLRTMIIAVDGNSDRNVIQKFVSQELPSRDSLAFRTHVREQTPDLDMNFDFSCDECGNEERMSVPMTAQFFWPDAGR